jgi:pyruvate formate lyase activating enzyme
LSLNLLNDNPESVALKRIVLSISRMTVHNGPGIRTLILFKGCPLRCLWCSTPESQKADPEIAFFQNSCTHCNKCIPVCPLNAISSINNAIIIDRSLCNNCGKCAQVCYPEALKLLGKPMTVEELLKEAKKDVVIYKNSHGGVTISGGEPLLDTVFNGQLLRAFKKESISAGIDTSGYVPWSNIEPLLPYIDFFLWDIKHMDPEKHKSLTGASNQLILDNLRAVSLRNIPVYLRLPLITGYNDSEDNIKAACEFARGLSSVVELDLLPLHHLGQARYESLNRIYPIADLPFVPDDRLQDLKNLVESYGLKCNIVA